MIPLLLSETEATFLLSLLQLVVADPQRFALSQGQAASLQGTLRKLDGVDIDFRLYQRKIEK